MPPAEEAAPEFRRQRGRPRHLQRPRGRDRLRRLHRQRGAEGQRRPGRDGQQHAARIARSHHLRARSAYVLAKGLPAISGSGWITPSTAARRCWACAACASSATGAPTPTPSRTPSAWRRSFPPASVNQRIEDELRAASRDRCRPSAGRPRAPPRRRDAEDAEITRRILMDRKGMIRTALLAVLCAAVAPDPGAAARGVEPRVLAGAWGNLLVRAEAKIEPGWHLYSASTPAGIPTTFQVEPASNRLVERMRVLQPAPRRAFDSNFEADTETYEGRRSFCWSSGLRKESAGVAELRISTATRSVTTSSAYPPGGLG